MVAPLLERHAHEARNCAQRLREIALAELFARDPDRTRRMSASAAGLRLDLSRERLDDEALAVMLRWADASGIAQARDAMVAGAAINRSEGRPVLHMAMRWPDGAASPFPQAVTAEARSVRSRGRTFAERLRAGIVRAADAGPIEALLHLGIGGSDLGPRLVAEALAPHASGRLQLRFAANVDPADAAGALKGLDPRRTMVLVVSKTFTTAETLANANAARAWLAGAVGETGLSSHLAAVTAAPARAEAWGAPAGSILPMLEGVGGRYSLWSAVGVGLDAWLEAGAFDRLSSGAAAMDRHFLEAPLNANLPVLAGLARTFARVGFGVRAAALIPYAQRLRLLPAWLQQLEMESNGKGVDQEGRALPCPAASIVFGEPGTLAQHSFFQMLHQGVEPIPVEFVIARDHGEVDAGAVRTLNAHALAQAQALLVGRRTQDADPALAAQRACPGDRPSTMIGLDDLSPEAIGALLAFFEHRTFVEGALWGLNSFDQWGVELGKALAGGVETALAGGSVPGDCDPATLAWIAWLRSQEPVAGP